MKDNFSELVKFSPYGGEVILEEVEGSTNGILNPENNVDTVRGNDRDMYAYVPKTGCPHAKQAAVFMVLRNDGCKESALETIRKYKLDELAEAYHFILLLPNPLKEGWNYNTEPDRENDSDFLVRCFAALPKSKGKVAGFNGMIYYLGTDPQSSAMAMTLAVRSPLDAAAVMVGEFAADYHMPESRGAEQVGWVYGKNDSALEYMTAVNHAVLGEEKDGCRVYVNPNKPCVRNYATETDLSAELVEKAWDVMFSETRRWRNDVFGIYQPRIDFEKEGFVKHVKDTSLGDNEGFAHTWYEYVPESVKQSDKKVPVVIYFHGINCIALYGAEQSGWAVLAKRDGFIAVFPDPCIEERWNVWDDRRLPSDMDFIMALLKHLKETYPVDESRIYASGFSMGSMMTNAITSSYPEVFAGGVALNGPNVEYLTTLDASKAGMLMFRPNSVIKDLEPSEETTTVTRRLSDAKKAEFDYRMPFVQFVGLLDNVGFNPKHIYPIQDASSNSWVATIDQWKKFNGIEVKEMYSDSYASGLMGDENQPFGGRFLDQYWFTKEGHEDLYHFISAERMPHAVDLKEVEYGWNIIKKYHRDADGTLVKE